MVVKVRVRLVLCRYREAGRGRGTTTAWDTNTFAAYLVERGRATAYPVQGTNTFGQPKMAWIVHLVTLRSALLKQRRWGGRVLLHLHEFAAVQAGVRWGDVGSNAVSRGCLDAAGPFVRPRFEPFLSKASPLQK